MNLNKVIIIGRLTRDPELRTTPQGQQVASFGVATNRVWTNQNGERQEKTEFHNVVVWRKLAEICGQYLSKGQLVMVEGRLETRSWEGQDGIKRSRTEIIAENMQMGPRAANTATESGQVSSKEEIPTVQVEEPVKNAEADKTKESNQENKNEEEIKVENIPF